MKESGIRTEDLGEPRRRLELWMLFASALILIAAGIGLRSPWPADEPRYALIARDMVETGEWFFPRVGGELYQDKPPVFFWLIGVAYAVTGSLRIAFLLPSLIAALGVLWLVYDLARRWWNHRYGILASAALLATVQFAMQAKRGQIDMVLCFFATLALYGLARHLRGGPAWGWYAVAFAAMGLGVITKGVGFLPVFMLVPYGWAVRNRWHDATRSRSWLWIIGPLAMFAVICGWLGPMLYFVSNSGNPALEAYRDEILFKQTADRYADPWGHIRPFWYYFGNVIPFLWLPLSIAIPWLIPRWWRSIRERDLGIFLLVGWIALVFFFFSATPGKRGVYVLIALPATALASAPWIAELWDRRGVHRTAFAVTVLLTTVLAAAALVNAIAPPAEAVETSRELGLGLTPPLALLATGGMLGILLFRIRRGVAGFLVMMTVVWLAASLWIGPSIDRSRSGRQFVEKLNERIDSATEIGLVQWKEQFLLYLDRPVTHFGHRRSVTGETYDAVAWLTEAPGRSLVVDHDAYGLCFRDGSIVDEAHGSLWHLVDADDVREECIALGDARVARTYPAS